MLIHSYCYEDRSGKTGLFGPQDIGVLAEWGNWRHAALRRDVPAFLDMPGAGSCRIFLLSIPDAGKIAFALPLENISTPEAVNALYSALMKVDPDNLRDTIAMGIPFELRTREQPQSQPLPLPVRFDDLNGLQLIGNTEKALSTIAGMSSPAWSEKFFLAVNPLEYRNEYSTVVSAETPGGQWLKLTAVKEAETIYTHRFRTLRRIARKRSVRLAILILTAVLAGLLIRSRYAYAAAQDTIRKLKTENENLKFQLERKDDRIRLLEAGQKH